MRNSEIELQPETLSEAVLLGLKQGIQDQVEGWRSLILFVRKLFGR